LIIDFYSCFDIESESKTDKQSSQVKGYTLLD